MMENDKRISLHLIVKDEVKEVTALLNSAYKWFDGIFVTVSDKKAYEELKKQENDTIKFDYRKWNDKFDDARNHNWELGKDFEFSMWLDADDRFNFTNMPKILDQFEEYDAVFLPYYYEFDENGNLIVSHWRERVVRRSKNFKWKGWVHECLISDEHFKTVNLDIPVIHVTKEGHKDSSAERNHKILVKAYEETNDPRYIHYLGISYFTLKEFEKAIEILNEYIKVGGWDEEIYRSLIKMAEASHMLGNYEDSIEYALQATGLMPHYPMAYEILGHFEFTAQKYKEAIEWIKVGLTKPYPKTASIFDPTSKERSMMTGAICEYFLGNATEAYQILRRLKSIDVSGIIDTFKYESEVETLIQILPTISKMYKDKHQLWCNLDDEIKWKPELRKFRESVTQPKVWGSKSVVYFCGKGYEEWGPHTLDKGMGGSEEAVVYLTEQMAKQGYEVTVYGEVSETITTDAGVVWKHWKKIDRRDEFNTLIIWRMPQFASQFKAKKMLIDVHDLLPEELVKPYENAHYMFKTQWHKDQYPAITNYSIVANGIEAAQFKDKVAKRPFSVIYASAYYRGLETLANVWKQIKEEVPEATLDIYYGWQSWVANEGEDAFYQRMNKKLEILKDFGVTEHGRVDHKTLASKFLESKVWAYPTEFPEIFCMTAVKASLAGCKPIITDVAALAETGGPAAKFIETNKISTDEYNQRKFVKAVVAALKEEHDSTEQIKWAEKFDWSNIAKQWGEDFND